MKLSELKEMAVRNPLGFDLTQDQWDNEIENYKNSKELKQINVNKFIKQVKMDDQDIYSLWVDDVIVSYAKFDKIKINGQSINNFLFTASNPSLNKKGYATELIWELHLTLNDDIYIGGVVSSKGEKLITGLVKMYQKIRSSEPPLINYVTGEKEPYNFSKFISKPKLGILLEDCCFFEAYKEITSKKFWLNDNVDLEGYP
jgi:hypothetical protein